MLRGNFALAYHGCDEGVGERVLRNEAHVSISENEYDWLGKGAYFWENSPARALNWAEFIKNHPQHFKHRIKKPFVVGAIINLGNCLDLTDTESLKFISNSYSLFKDVHDVMETKMPVNEPSHTGGADLVKCHLDCAVINFVHFVRETNGQPPFDTVRGIFTEGGELYPGAKIMSKTHVQICVRNPALSVKAYFRPMSNQG
jgi:hypothetical protein